MPNMRSSRLNTMTLKQLKKRSDKYFRGSAIIKKGRRRNKTIEYIVSRTFEALPENLKKYLKEDRESIIANLTQQVIAFKEYDINPYMALEQMAKFKKRAMGDGTKEYIWSRFVNEYSRTYHRYYNYMRRIGYNPKEYWWSNVGVQSQGSITETQCELPNKYGGYELLEINVNFSGDGIEAILY